MKMMIKKLMSFLTALSLFISSMVVPVNFAIAADQFANDKAECAKKSATHAWDSARNMCVKSQATQSTVNQAKRECGSIEDENEKKQCIEDDIKSQMTESPADPGWINKGGWAATLSWLNLIHGMAVSEIISNECISIKVESYTGKVMSYVEIINYWILDEWLKIKARDFKNSTIKGRNLYDAQAQAIDSFIDEQETISKVLTAKALGYTAASVGYGAASIIGFAETLNPVILSSQCKPMKSPNETWGSFFALGGKAPTGADGNTLADNSENTSLSSQAKQESRYRADLRAKGDYSQEAFGAFRQKSNADKIRKSESDITIVDPNSEVNKFANKVDKETKEYRAASDAKLKADFGAQDAQYRADNSQSVAGDWKFLRGSSEEQKANMESNSEQAATLRKSAKEQQDIMDKRSPTLDKGSEYVQKYDDLKIAQKKLEEKKIESKNMGTQIQTNQKRLGEIDTQLRSKELTDPQRQKLEAESLRLQNQNDGIRVDKSSGTVVTGKEIVGLKTKQLRVDIEAKYMEHGESGVVAQRTDLYNIANTTVDPNASLVTVPKLQRLTEEEHRQELVNREIVAPKSRSEISGHLKSLGLVREDPTPKFEIAPLDIPTEGAPNIEYNPLSSSLTLISPDVQAKINTQIEADKISGITAVENDKTKEANTKKEATPVPPVKTNETSLTDKAKSAAIAVGNEFARNQGQVAYINRADSSYEPPSKQYERSESYMNFYRGYNDIKTKYPVSNTPKNKTDEACTSYSNIKKDPEFSKLTSSQQTSVNNAITKFCKSSSMNLKNDFNKLYAHSDLEFIVNMDEQSRVNQGKVQSMSIKEFDILLNNTQLIQTKVFNQLTSVLNSSVESLTHVIDKAHAADSIAGDYKDKGKEFAIGKFDLDLTRTDLGFGYLGSKALSLGLGATLIPLARSYINPLIAFNMSPLSVTIFAGIETAQNIYLANAAFSDAERAKRNVALLKTIKAKLSTNVDRCPSGRDSVEVMHSSQECYCYTEDGKQNPQRTNSDICKSKWASDSLKLNLENTLNGLSTGATACMYVNGQVDLECKCKKLKDQTGGNACMKTASSLGSLNNMTLNNLMSKTGGGSVLDSYTAGGAKGTSAALSTLSNAVKKMKAAHKDALDIFNKEQLRNGRPMLDFKNPKTFKAMTDKLYSPDRLKEVSGLGGQLPASGLGNDMPVDLKKSLEKQGVQFQGGNGMPKDAKRQDTAFNFGDDGGGQGPQVINAADKKNYDYKDAGISGKENSIFDILTNRYQQTGLKKIFEEPTK